LAQLKELLIREPYILNGQYILPPGCHSVSGNQVHSLYEEPPPPDGVCHVAAVPEVAVRTCPADGAVALLTLIVVVAD
jgi:hypothetical protein